MLKDTMNGQKDYGERCSDKMFHLGQKMFHLGHRFLS